MIDVDNDERLDGRPRWSGVFKDTADRLEYLATGGSEPGWPEFLAAVRAVAAEHANRVNPNRLRPLLKEAGIEPHRVGSFYRRALLAGVLSITPDLWDTSTDVGSRNRGKPVRVYTFQPERDQT